MEDKPYAITNEQGKQFVTSQYVRATHGKAERKWPFITCSDSKITEVSDLHTNDNPMLTAIPSLNGIVTRILVKLRGFHYL